MNTTAPVPPEVVPGRGVHLTPEELHAYQHYCIERDLYAYLSLPRGRRGDLVKGRIEASKKAFWTLSGHVRALHGRRTSITDTYESLAEAHRAFHQEDSSH